MLIYPNMPGWGTDEVLQVTVGLLRPGAASQQRHQLQTMIEADVNGWSVALLASGRYALKLAIEFSGLSGRRLAVPAYVCPAVLVAARAAGTTVVAIDCDAESFKFDRAALKYAVDSRQVDGILATNTYGLDQDFVFLRQLGLPIIDDAAYQAGRIDRNGEPCGTRGCAGVWSFNFKAMSGLGGGVLLLPNGAAATGPSDAPRRSTDFRRWLNYSARSLMRHHVPKFLAPFRASEPSTSLRPAWLTMTNGMMSRLQIAVNLAQWHKRSASSRAEAEARDGLIRETAGSDVFTTVRGSEDGTHFVPVLVDKLVGDPVAAVANVRRSLYADGVQTESAYPVLPGPRTAVSNAAALASRLFLLPCHSGLEETQVGRIQLALRRAATELRRSAFDQACRTGSVTPA